MIITFDKGLANERWITVDHYSESILQNRMSCNANLKESDYPDLEHFTSVNFSTMEILKGDKKIRFAGHYNTISNLAISYDEFADNYNLSLGLAWTDEEKE